MAFSSPAEHGGLYSVHLFGQCLPVEQICYLGPPLVLAFSTN